MPLSSVALDKRVLYVPITDLIEASRKNLVFSVSPRAFFGMLLLAGLDLVFLSRFLLYDPFFQSDLLLMFQLCAVAVSRIQFSIEIVLSLNPDETLRLGDYGYIHRSTYRLRWFSDFLFQRLKID